MTPALARPVARPDDDRPVRLRASGLGVDAGGLGLFTDLDLQIRAGEFWCLLGRNGAGKTLLLQTLAGARAPAAGTVEVDGRRLADWSPGALARRRGYLPQTLHDSFATPVLEVVLQGRHPHRSRWQWEGADGLEHGIEALARVGLAGFEARDVRSLSGGERQRVALATLLTQDPPLALLDEPLAHLDLAQQLRMLALLEDEVAHAGRAVLMSVHDPSLAQRVATHVLMLSGHGHPPVSGRADEVLTEDILGRVFDLPLQRHDLGGRRWWLPA